MEMTMMTGKSEENERNNNNVQYKGVRQRRWGKWVSEIRLPNSRERIWLGSYDTPEKAARAFDAALFCLRGKNAKFNFPDKEPDIPGGGSLSRREIQAAAAKYANEEPPQAQAKTHIQHHQLELLDDNYTSPLPMDWEFLDMLTASRSSSSGSDFVVFSGTNDFPGQFLPPQTEAEDFGDENEGGAISAQQSFLWNF